MSMKISWGIMIILLLIALPVVVAEQNQQTNKIYLNPFYRVELERNTDYEYVFTLDPPEKIGTMQSAIINFQMWLSPTVEFELLVDGQACNNPTYEVHTTYAGAGEGSIFFDCSNVITGKGDYVVTLTSNDDTGAVTGWVDVTYAERAEVTAQIHGTEYAPGDATKVFLQLLDDNFDPLDNTNNTCWASIYYPDDTVYKHKQAMHYVDEGLWVYNIDSPNVAGVYMVSGLCGVGINTSEYEYISDDFESENSSGGTGWVGAWNLETCIVDDQWSGYDGDWYLDCNFDDISGSGAANRVIHSLSVDNNDELSWSFAWLGYQFGAGDELAIQIQDASGNNFTMYTIENGDDDDAWHLSTGTFTTTFDGIDLDGDIKFQVSPSASMGTNEWFQIDAIDIILSGTNTTLYTEYEEIRGSGEIHVKSDKNYEAKLSMGEMTNTSFLEDFTYHYNVTSLEHVRKADQKIELELFLPFPCPHVTEVNERFTNGSVIEITDWVGETDNNGRCVVEFWHDLDILKVYDFEIVSENYWKNIFYKDYSSMLLEQEMVNITCQNYVTANNLTNFTVPMNSIPYGADPLWLTCASYLDTAHHYIESSAQFAAVSNINYNWTLEEMEAMESDWMHLTKIKIRANTLFSAISNGLQLASDYSVGLVADPYPPTNPDYATYFASISSSYLSFQQLYGIVTGAIQVNATAGINSTEIADTIWSSPVRTLTNFDFLVGLNTTAISDVWSYVTRGLTEPVTATVNTTEVSDAVWNSTVRYTHGVDLT